MRRCGGCSSPQSGCQAAIQKAFKRLEKWATKKFISKASAKSHIWKRTAPCSNTGCGLTDQRVAWQRRISRVMAGSKLKMNRHVPLQQRRPQLHTGVYQQKCSQVDKGSDSSPLCCIYQSTYRVSYPFLGSSIQEGCRQAGTSLVEGYKDQRLEHTTGRTVFFCES